MSKGFDPKKASQNRMEVAGEYLLVAMRHKRDSARSGKPYTLVSFKIIDGPMKGKSFSERVYLNDESLWKVGRFCEAVGYEDAFDLDDDAVLTKVICRKPFKARVDLRRDGNGAYPQIAKFFLPKELSEAEKKIATEWVANAAVEGEQDGGSSGGWDSDDPGPDDKDIPF